MILSSSLVLKHDLAAESVFGTSQNGGPVDVWVVCGGVTGWCQDNVWRVVWGGRVWEGSGGCHGVSGGCPGRSGRGLGVV